MKIPRLIGEVPMGEIEKILTDRRLSLSARGLLALVMSMPEDWKYRWADMVELVPDATELGNARKELQKYGIDPRSCVRAPVRDNNNSILNSSRDKNCSSSARTRTDVCAHTREREYPGSTEDVISAAADRAYSMSVSEAANFIAHYGASGWETKDGRPIRDWRLLLDRWKVGQSREQYLQAQNEWRRRRKGLPPQKAEKYVTLETGEQWPEEDSVYLHDEDVWVKASGAY